MSLITDIYAREVLIHVGTQPLKQKSTPKLVVLGGGSSRPVLQLVNTKPLNFVTVTRTASVARVF